MLRIIVHARSNSDISVRYVSRKPPLPCASKKYIKAPRMNMMDIISKIMRIMKIKYVIIHEVPKGSVKSSREVFPVP